MFRTRSLRDPAQNFCGSIPSRAVLAAALLLAGAARGQDFAPGPSGEAEGGARFQESYALKGDDVLIRETAQGDGDLLLPPSVALALKYGLKLRVEDAAGRELKLADLGKPTRHGPTIKVEGQGEYVIRAPLAKYIFEVPAAPPAAAEDKALVEELARRVGRFVESGHQGPVPREYGFKANLVFWFEGETVSALAQALPYLPPAAAAKARAYLAREVEAFLLDPKNLDFERAGKAGIAGWGNNDAAKGQAIAALFDYAHGTGDWALAAKQWDACRREFGSYLQLDWRVGCNPRTRLHTGAHLRPSDLPAQAAAACAVARLARKLRDRPAEALAAGLAARLLITRYAWGVYVRPYLYENKMTEAPSRKEKGKAIDTLPARERYPLNNWPYDAPPSTVYPKEMRFFPDGSNDPRLAVEPTDGKTYRVGMLHGDSNIKSLALHYPAPPELLRFLGDTLKEREREFFEAFQAHMPWWHWCDFETIIERGDETVASPDISFSMYQTLAWTLGADGKELRRRLPWEYLNVGFRDRYRMINIGTYLRAKGGARWEGVP